MCSSIVKWVWLDLNPNIMIQMSPKAVNENGVNNISVRYEVIAWFPLSVRQDIPLTDAEQVAHHASQPMRGNKIG